MTAKELTDLLESVRNYVMSPEEIEAQRRSFAYGNAKMENPDVTMEMVDEAAERLDAKTKENPLFRWESLMDRLDRGN
jgi:hypothetical protein